MSHCDTVVSKQALHMFPVNHNLLGQVVMMKLGKEEQISLAAGPVIKTIPIFDDGFKKVKSEVHIKREDIVIGEIDRTILKTRSLLTALERLKIRVETESILDKLSNHFESCHAELELEKNEKIEILKQEEERRFNNSGERSENGRFEIVIDKNIFHDLNDHIKMIGITDHGYLDKPELLSNCGGTMVTVDSDEGSDGGNIVTICGEESYCSSESVTDGVSDLHPFTETEAVFEELELVEVIFVETPGSFYVRRAADWGMVESLRSELEAFGKKCNNFMEENVSYKQGQIIAVDVRNVMTRGRVESVEDATAVLTYIDIGGAGPHPVDQLAPLPGHLSTLPGLVHHCALAGISPAGPQAGVVRLLST